MERVDEPKHSGNINDITNLFEWAYSVQEVLNANADEAEREHTDIMEIVTEHEQAINDHTDAMGRFRTSIDLHIAGHDYLTESTTPDAECSEDYQNGHWECDNCGKNWGNGHDLLLESEWSELSNKDITWFCEDIGGDNGCHLEDVTWHPHESPQSVDIDDSGQAILDNSTKRYWYECQESAFAPGIADGWPEVIPAPHTKNGRLVRREYPAPNSPEIPDSSDDTQDQSDDLDDPELWDIAPPHNNTADVSVQWDEQAATGHIPNDLTRQAMEATDRGEDITRHESVEGLMADLDDTQELKPCMCGGEGEIVTKYSESENGRRETYFVECLDCHLTTDYSDDVDTLIHSWNTRPIEDELREAWKTALRNAGHEASEHAKSLETINELRAEILWLHDRVEEEHEGMWRYKRKEGELRTENKRLHKKLAEETERHIEFGADKGEEIAKMKAENERLKAAFDFTYCAYCGEEFPMDDDAATKVGEHIKTCPKHPMRDIETDLAAANEKIERAQNRTQSAFTEMIGYPGPNVGQQLVLIALRKILAALDGDTGDRPREQHHGRTYTEYLD